jgi:hypothetical protein
LSPTSTYDYTDNYACVTSICQLRPTST